MKEGRAEVLVVGGGLGGVAAAPAAARMGRQVILVSEHRWLGGRLTTQGVPPDEHPWVEMFGATESYRTLRRNIRSFYRRNYPLIGPARHDPYLNPGNAWVSRIAHEPRVAARVIDAMLTPHEAAGNLVVLRGYRATAAAADGDYVRAVNFTGEQGESLVLVADYVLDATELGDLLELAGVEHVVGAESQAQTGEPHAPSEPQPLNQQSFTWVFAVEHRPGENHTIERPAMYDLWRAYKAPFWPAAHLSWTYPHPVTLGPVEVVLDFDDPAVAYTGRLGKVPVPPPRINFWTYRRVLYGKHFEGPFRDVVVVNWPQNDYWLKPLIGASRETRDRALYEARQLSLSIDLHPSTAGTNYIDLDVWPHQIPLGALIPVRMENLLPAAKNLGTTPITNGCYRLHPIEWNVGEAAGLLAAYCLAHHTSPRSVRNRPERLEDFQRLLVAQGIELDWPSIHPI